MGNVASETTFDYWKVVFSCEKMRKRALTFEGLCSRLRLTFLKSFCNFRKFGLKKLWVFFSIRRVFTIHMLGMGQEIWPFWTTHWKVMVKMTKCGVFPVSANSTTSGWIFQSQTCPMLRFRASLSPTSLLLLSLNSQHNFRLQKWPYLPLTYMRYAMPRH